MSNPTGCVPAPTTAPRRRCDVLLGVEGIHVEAVERDEQVMTVTMSTPAELMGCPDCGVVSPSRGRRRRILRNIPAGGIPVRLV